MRRLLSLAVLALMTAAAPALAQKPGARQPAAPAAPMAPIRYQAVMASGDGSLPVWDNAVSRFMAGLQSAGVLAGDPVRLTSSGKAQAGMPLATAEGILRSVAAMRPGAGEGCLVFLTSHGIPRMGLALTASPQTPISPQALDAALSRGGCAQAPTLVVVSSCYSGDFARVLARPNRAVMTAARADRPSFGCGAGYQYTVFDECLLQTLEERPALWTETVRATRACVTRRERELNANPSEPQASIGQQVAGLRSPLSR